MRNKKAIFMSPLNCPGYFMQKECKATVWLFDHSGGCAHSFSQMTRVWIKGRIIKTEICSCGQHEGAGTAKYADY